MNKGLFTLGMAVAGLIVLAGCTARQEASSVSLMDTQWTLTELNGNPIMPGTTISARFSEDSLVGGSSGCNRYSTTYMVQGNKISFGEQGASTLMACLPPIMDQESAYLEALAATTSFEISDDELILYDDSDNPVAVFAVESQSLAGTSWEVISYNNGRGAVTSVIIGTEITAVFGEDDQITGNAGCNDYFAPYETLDDSISIGPVGSTQKICSEPEGIMEQESEYLTALGTASTYSVEGLMLDLRTSEGSRVASMQRRSNP
jgi:heat shock protein HslJ